MTHHDYARDPARLTEFRPGAGFAKSPGHVVHPSGSLIASTDPGFLAAACGLVLDLHDTTRRGEA